MNIDFSKMITAEQRKSDQLKADLDAAYAQRRAAYQAESDPLRLEIAYDAMMQGLEPDFTPWKASVTAIKSRYPLPESTLV
ncbi:hypothetical protein [Pseudomonas sp. TWP3-2]|uniref:hypothetical protein n=1 Tax=Pseudomonas sp. TWP3-2 TaxID=2804574 RepID=UPI003CEB7EA9